MPSILTINGFRFIIWPADHEPPHVHVFKGGGEAKVSIGDNDQAPQLILVCGLNKREAWFIMETVAAHQAQLLNAWERFMAARTIIHSDINLLREPASGSRGARHPHVLTCTLRRLRSWLPQCRLARYDFCRHV